MNLTKRSELRRISCRGSHVTLVAASAHAHPDAGTVQCRSKARFAVARPLRWATGSRLQRSRGGCSASLACTGVLLGPPRRAQYSSPWESAALPTGRRIVTCTAVLLL